MKLNEITEDYFLTSLYEMSNYGAGDTGLTKGTVLWVRAEPIALQHVRYRIKLIHPQKGEAIFAVWGDDAEPVKDNKTTWSLTGKDLKRVRKLVQLTHEQIRAHIDGELSSGQLARVFDEVRSQVETI